MGEIPAIIKNLSDTETASVALIENLQREELTPIEEAMAYDKLVGNPQLNTRSFSAAAWKGPIHCSK